MEQARHERCVQLAVDPPSLSLRRAGGQLRVGIRQPDADRVALAENRKYLSNAAIDLIDRLLQYDHVARPSAAEAMQHPYFEQVRVADRKRVEEEERARRGEAGESAAGSLLPILRLSTSSGRGGRALDWISARPS